MHRLVGHPHMQRLGVSVGMNRDRTHPKPLSSADHAARNLAAIGDQQRVDHPAGQPVMRDEKVMFMTFHAPFSRTRSKWS